MKKFNQYKPKKTSAKSFKPKEQKRNSRKMGYDSDWDKYRFRFLHHNPKCYCCGRISTVVDHIKAHKGDMDLFRNTHNHMPLCKHHHDTITGKFDRKEIPDLEGKLRYINQCRDKYKTTIKIKILPSYIKFTR